MPEKAQIRRNIDEYLRKRKLMKNKNNLIESIVKNATKFNQIKFNKNYVKMKDFIFTELIDKKLLFIFYENGYENC